MDPVNISMLGYAEEHAALLQALLRELSDVDVQLNNCLGTTALENDGQGNRERLLTARLETLQAMTAIRAAVAAPVDKEWTEGAGTIDQGDVDLLKQAVSLRSAAMADRDLVEAKRNAQRGERAELLKRLAELAEQTRRENERREKAFASETVKERELEDHCQALEKETQDLRAQLIKAGDRLDARNTMTRFFRVKRRGVARQHAKATQEAMGARLILNLKRVTDAHLAKVEAETNQIIEGRDAEQARHRQRMLELQQQHEARMSKHKDRVQELQQEIDNLQQSFEHRWAEGEEQLRQQLGEQEKRAQQTIEKLGQELSKQGDALRRDVAAAQEACSEQQLDLSEVGDELEKDIRTQLESKRRAMEVNAEGERCRFAVAREKMDNVTDHFVQESQMFAQGIKYLKETYSSQSRSPRCRGVSPRPEVCKLLSEAYG
eukprot:TRINITY_DN61036_c0_g1_i1.p1 TRINITY_DN61036_c0_g1~~TRINITY_DN61036_c0_g1_i1.p1  ORF type:complete len:435 (+),score=112.69 TRINITY_DN61036_c0_g1_i1:126-1430(+)